MPYTHPQVIAVKATKFDILGSGVVALMGAQHDTGHPAAFVLWNPICLSPVEYKRCWLAWWCRP